MEESNENCRKKPNLYCFTSPEMKKTSKEENPTNDQHRINFLTQCKLELSSEVVRWKEETVKMQKDRDSALKKSEELQLFMNKLARKNQELETRLFLSWEENKRLKMRSLAIGEENSALHERLTKTKYHSYPWTELKNATSSSSHTSSDDTALELGESWEEVSQKLYRQMQKEMQEMQRLSQSLAESDRIFEQVENASAKKPPVPIKDKTIPVEAKSIEARISKMTMESEALKHHVQIQNEKLQFLLNKSNTKSVERNEPRTLSAKTLPSIPRVTSFASNSPVNILEEENRNSRPTDETFRAYFTQQLNKGNMNEEKKVTQVYLNREGSEISEPLRTSTPKVTHQETKMTLSKSSKVSNVAQKGEMKCPICKVTFVSPIPQEEFEAHVIAHLDAASVKLMNQYQML